LGARSLGADYGPRFTPWGIAGVGEAFLVALIKTATGALTNVIYTTAGACALGILLARGRQATET
jgi:uncharacterized membrane protein YuzA (DUF378 family)